MGPVDITDVQNVTTLYGADTLEVQSTDDCRVYRTTHSNGSGTVEKFDVLPGIQLYNQRFQLTSLDYDQSTPRYSKDIITINHCRRGRFEAEFADGEFLYLGEGDLAMNLPENAPVRHSFPLTYFQGITIIISVSNAMTGMCDSGSILGPVPIDLSLLRERLLKGNEFIIFRSNPESERILEDMYRERQDSRIFYLRLMVLELLLFLLTSGETVGERPPYFHRNHVMTIKNMTQYLLEHLDRNFTLEELSGQFEIPLSTMKKCFKAVYGKPIHAYVRDYRMQTAAKLLRETDLSIAEIAEQMSYSNQSKFTGAFKTRMGCTPLAYRNLKT